MEKTVDYYLEKPKKKKKLDKKESQGGNKPNPVKKSSFKIIDDDIDINSLTPSQDAEILVDLLDPEGPTIADESEIRAFEMKPKTTKVDMFTNNTWVKVDVFENEDGDLVVADQQKSEVSSKGLFKKRGEKKSAHNSSTQNDNDDDDLDVPRRKDVKVDSDGDISPVRVRSKKPESGDNDLDDIPRRKTVKRDSDGDLSPVRKSDRGEKSRMRKKSDDQDLSPARKPSVSSTVTRPQVVIKTEKDLSPERRSSSNKTTDIKKEKDLSPDRNSSAGQPKETTEGSFVERISLRKPKKVEDEAKKAKEEELKKKYEDWKKGLVQIRQHEEKIKDYLHEVNKPVARHADDKDLEDLLKKQEREDDPMLEYMRNNQEDAKSTGSKKSYRGPPAPPNRYNIMPGSKWDGVDRSNGFEKKYYESITARKVREQEAYKWSTEDM